MKTFKIPTKKSEAPHLCPFGCGSGLHRELTRIGKVFMDPEMPKALAVYFCGTYIWDNGTFDQGSDCIGILRK